MKREIEGMERENKQSETKKKKKLVRNKTEYLV